MIYVNCLYRYSIITLHIIEHFHFRFTLFPQIKCPEALKTQKTITESIIGEIVLYFIKTRKILSIEKLFGKQPLYKNI